MNPANMEILEAENDYPELAKLNIKEYFGRRVHDKDKYVIAN